MQRLSDLDEEISDGTVITKIIMSLLARLMVEEDRLGARGAIETAEALIGSVLGSMAKKGNQARRKTLRNEKLTNQSRNVSVAEKLSIGSENVARMDLLKKADRFLHVALTVERKQWTIGLWIQVPVTI